MEASKKIRLFNFLIDLLALLGLMALGIQLKLSTTTSYPIDIVMIFLLIGGYHLLMEYFFGKTIGKYITKTKVVDLNGNNISFRTAFIRTLCRRIPFNTLSLLMGADARAWHDALSGTKVIEDK